MLRPLCAFVFVLASVPSQQTLVVDQATGPYTTIGAAVAAASPGDRIEVHPGNYRGFTVSIGVEIVAPLGNVVVGGYVGLTQTISIVQLPAAQSLRLDGIALPSYWGFGPPTYSFSKFEILNCAGAVHLHRVTTTADCCSVGILNTVNSSTRVTFSNCGLTGVVLTNSSATFDTCNVVGITGVAGMAPGPGQNGLRLQQSHVFLSHCTIAGGTGGTFTGSFLPGGQGGYAVSGDAASLLVAVGPGAITGGFDGGPLGSPHGPQDPAIVGLPPANMRLGPSIAVTPVQPVTTIAEPPQLVSPLTLPLGTNVAISVGNAANQFVLLGIDTAHDLIALPVIEMPFVLSTAASLYAFAPPSPTSPTSFSLFVPPAPWLANVFVYWQAVTVANDGTIQFSNGGYGRIQ